MRKAQVKLLENVEYILKDKNGNIKKLFQPNRLMVWMMKSGLLSPHAPKIPILFGHWTDKMVYANLITTAGKASVAARINAAAADAAYTAIGIGIGTTAADVANTTLETEKKADGSAASGVHALATASVTASRVTTTVTNDTAQLVGTISFTASLAVTESGVFNADTNGTLLARQVFSAINVVSGDTLQLTWKIKAA